MVAKISIRMKSNIDIVRKGKEQLRAKVPKVARSRLKAAANELKKRMSKVGKRVKYPINWASEKQKWYVIIMLRKRKMLPYKRTGKHARGWKVTVLKSGYSVKNSEKTSVYLYGNAAGQRQSRIHQGRWNLLRDQADIVIRSLPVTVQREMVELAKKVPNK